MAKISLTELTFQIMEKIIASSKIESKEKVEAEAKEYISKVIALNSPKEMVVASYNAFDKIKLLSLEDLKDIKRIISL